MAIFSFERLLHPAIHEVGDVGVLFGFGCSVLTQALRGHHLSQQVVERFGREGHLNRQARFVLGEGHHIELRPLGPLKSIEALAHQALHDLARSIRSEVEHQQRVAILEMTVGKPDGFHELIGDFAGVARFQGLSGRERAHRQRGVGQQVIGLFRAFPALISVHGPVAAAQAHDSADAT